MQLTVHKVGGSPNPYDVLALRVLLVDDLQQEVAGGVSLHIRAGQDVQLTLATGRQVDVLRFHVESGC